MCHLVVKLCDMLDYMPLILLTYWKVVSRSYLAYLTCQLHQILREPLLSYWGVTCLLDHMPFPFGSHDTSQEKTTSRETSRPFRCNTQLHWKRHYVNNQLQMEILTFLELASQS